MMAIEDLLARNATRTGTGPGPLPSPPGLQVAVVACMDARLDPVELLGLQPGDAHVIRNAGGVVTDDVIRSLAVSQRKLGTTEGDIPRRRIRRAAITGTDTTQPVSDGYHAVRGFVVNIETGDLDEIPSSRS